MKNEQINQTVKALKAVQELDKVMHQDQIKTLLLQSLHDIDHVRVKEYGEEPIVPPNEIVENDSEEME